MHKGIISMIGYLILYGVLHKFEKKNIAVPLNNRITLLKVCNFITYILKIKLKDNDL